MVQSIHQQHDQFPDARKTAALHHQHQRGAGKCRRKSEDRESGYFPRGGGFGAAIANPGRTAQIIAHENVLFRMSAAADEQRPASPTAAQPTGYLFR